MKKSRIYMGVGALVLAIANVFATLAYNKFTTIPAKSRSAFRGMVAVGNLASPPFTIIQANGITTLYVGLYTTNQTGIISGVTIVTSTNATKAIYVQ